MLKNEDKNYNYVEWWRHSLCNSIHQFEKIQCTGEGGGGQDKNCFEKRKPTTMCIEVNRVENLAAEFDYDLTFSHPALRSPLRYASVLGRMEKKSSKSYPNFTHQEINLVAAESFGPPVTAMVRFRVEKDDRKFVRFLKLFSFSARNRTVAVTREPDDRE